MCRRYYAQVAYYCHVGPADYYRSHSNSAVLLIHGMNCFIMLVGVASSVPKLIKIT